MLRWNFSYDIREASHDKLNQEFQQNNNSLSSDRRRHWDTIKWALPGMTQDIDFTLWCSELFCHYITWYFISLSVLFVLNHAGHTSCTLILHIQVLSIRKASNIWHEDGKKKNGVHCKMPLHPVFLQHWIVHYITQPTATVKIYWLPSLAEPQCKTKLEYFGSQTVISSRYDRSNEISEELCLTCLTNTSLWGCESGTFNSWLI